jgi:hypothetical protein
MHFFKKLILIYASIFMLGFVSSIDAKEATQLDTKKLIGKWLRSDSPYVLAIKKINKNGKLDAGYYNPRSIHISRAEFSQKKDELKVIIELSDEGYPGSTYTLNYNQKNDVLAGYYYHAGTNETFDVMFSKQKE